MGWLFWFKVLLQPITILFYDALQLREERWPILVNLTNCLPLACLGVHVLVTGVVVVAQTVR